MSYAQRWVERLLARYNAQGPQALGDLRRRNGTSPSVLRPDLLEKLKARLREPPPDGGLWTSPKVAAWMAGELGLAAVELPAVSLDTVLFREAGGQTAWKVTERR